MCNYHHYNVEYAHIMPNPKAGTPQATVSFTAKQNDLFSATQKLPSDAHTSNTERHWSKNLTTNLLSCLDPLERSVTLFLLCFGSESTFRKQ